MFLVFFVCIQVNICWQLFFYVWKCFSSDECLELKKWEMPTQIVNYLYVPQRAVGNLERKAREGEQCCFIG